MPEQNPQIIADLHIHSRYSRATSKNITLANLVKYAKIKGLNLLGTGDFTHPSWLREIKTELKEDEEGIYYLESFPFILTTEISLMYTQEKKGRRIHVVVLSPSLEITEQINEFLGKKGRLDYDGRPIFGMSGIDFVDAMLGISKDIEVIPAHVWTPWFGIFGSMSGFNSLEEAFGNREKQIHAIETGMSSDPEMNWKLSFLNNKTIVSFSDAHSFWPWRIGREATIFSFEKLSYKNIIKAIRENTIKATIETDPAYGKYHWDGHRLCNFSCPPAETRKLNGICPVCKKPLTIGVEYRVEELTDQNPLIRKNRKPFYKILPLHELISEVKASTLSSKKTWQLYNQLIEGFGNEFNVLLEAEKEKLARIDEKIADVIMQNRIGNMKVKPGYDGQYGIPLLKERQAKLL